MNFLLDKNAEPRMAAFLQELGHDIKVIGRDYPSALSDEEILNIAFTEGRVQIINDRDFGELIFHQGLSHSGVIYFRLGRLAAREDKIAKLEFIFGTHQDHLGQFIVVTADQVRVRRTTNG